MNPGESTGLEIRRLLSEELGTYLFLPAIFIFWAFWEWVRTISNSPPIPVHATIIAGIAFTYSVFKFFRIKRQIRNLKLGMEGEKAVGQYLEKLREKGYQILHDIPGEKFNIDHVLIGQAGIYVIETKTISKPKSGNPVIEYDGKQLKVNGFTPDRNPITQAQALANWIKELVKESTGREFPVRPVVLYPGWYINHQPKGAEVWVLNPKGFPTFLDHADKTITPEDVHLVTYHLCRYVRSRNGERRAA
jgi:hypothetical protein